MLIAITESGWYLIGATLLFLIIFIAFIFFFFKVKIKQNHYVLEQQKTRSFYEQTLLQTQLEIQEQTLKNISQEIHDNIGQILSLAKLHLNTITYAESDLYQSKIDDSKLLISKAIRDLRSLSRSLNTDYIVEMGLMHSVEYELELIKRTGTLQTELQVEGTPYRLEQQQELILFRIVQEVLHNIIKHAQATCITVQICFKPGVFSLNVADDGVGFDAGQLETNNYNGFGLGIRNMFNRAKMIKTEFRLSSSLGKGTVVSLEMPIAERN